jgi:hypothetical protein
MFRKSMIALFAIASISILAPDLALARGGGGGGGHGGGGGGGHGGGFGGGRAGSFGGGFARSAAIGAAGVQAGRFAVAGVHPGFRYGFHHGRRFIVGGFYGPYGYYDDYYDYPYYVGDDSYNGGCYIVRRRVHTKHGWRIQPLQVCG